MERHQAILLPVLSAWALASVILIPGCGEPSADDPLPREDNLLTYSLAVAQKVRLQLPEGQYIPVYHVGRVYQRFGLDDNALVWFRRAIKLEPDAPEPSREIGFILSQRKDRMEDAILAYRQSLRGEPDQTGIRTRIALLQIHMSHFEDAVGELRAEIEAGGATDLTHYNLAIALQSLEQHEEALEQFDAVTGMQNALYGKYRSLLALGRQDEAKTTLAAFREIKGQTDDELLEHDIEAAKSNRDEQLRHTGGTWLDAATAYLEESRRVTGSAVGEDYLNKAVDACHAALRFDERRIESWEFLINHYGQRGMHAECQDVLERAVAVFPEHALWRYRLALEMLQRAPKQQHPTQPSSEVEVSIRHLEKAIELAPRLHQAHLLRARAILYFNRRPELLPSALAHARRALEMNPQRSAENYDILAMALHYSGQHDAAYETLREAVRIFPDHLPLVRRLGTYQQQRSDATP